MIKNKQIVIVIGPTAVGKTEYAIEIAKSFNGEIISADSMQIYKYMDIGSAKPTKEELAIVKHHLVDEVDPLTPWSVADYQTRAKSYIKEVLLKNKLPVVSGGTGLYINSLLYNMDFSSIPRQDDLREQLEEEALIHGKDSVYQKLKQLDRVAAERIHPNNLKKVIRAIEVYKATGKGVPDFSQSFEKVKEFDWIVIGLNRDREKLYERINQRVDILIEKGLIEEVRNLLSIGLSEKDISMKGIGYKEIIGYIEGEYEEEEAVRLIKRNTRRYAKRQLTWFKRYPDTRWFNLSEYTTSETAMKAIFSYLNDRLMKEKQEC